MESLLKNKIFFTTCKEPNDQNALKIMEASFSSWKKLNLNVLIYCEDDTHSLADKYGFQIINSFDKDIFGLPLVKSIFLETQYHFRKDIYVYLNSDIILDFAFLKIIDSITLDDFMLVGRRTDIIGIPSLNFINQSKKEISLELSKFELKEHSFTGIDYFVYTKNFWDLKKMPKFRIARARFDHWLMGYALSLNKPVIDISNVYKPLHIEPMYRYNISWKSLFIKSRVLFIQFLLNRIYILFSKYNSDLRSCNYKLNKVGKLYIPEAFISSDIQDI